MKRRTSSSESGSNKGGSLDGIYTIRTRPPHIYDNITRRLLQFGITLAVTTFIGLIVRYAVQEFDPTVSTITVTTSRINNRDIASLSVSKHFLERILEFIEESIAIVAAIIPLGFPLCTIFNRYFAKMRSGLNKIDIYDDKVLSMIPKYVVVGDAQACQLPNSTRLRPLTRDTIYQLIKTRLKPKLIVEDSYDEARKLGIRIGLIRREHHKLAVIKSVDLLRNITDSRGDIKQGKVRYLLSRMKIMSQSTPADKSLLIYLIKHCETQPNENLAYLGYSFTDPEAMRMADCAITFQDCDDEDVKKSAQVMLKSENMNFTDFYLFIIVCLLTSNITQSYALYQISASLSCCIYRFLSITVFQEQLMSHSQFTLLIIIQQMFAIFALMTKWLSSLPQAPLRSSAAAEMSHAATEESLAAAAASSNSTGAMDTMFGSSKSRRPSNKHHYRSTTSVSGNGFADNYSHSPNGASHHEHLQTDQPGGHTSIRMQRIGGDTNDDTIGSSSLDSDSSSQDDEPPEIIAQTRSEDHSELVRRKFSHGPASMAQQAPLSAPKRARHRRNKVAESSQHIFLSGIDLNQAVINSNLVTSYKQTFHNSSLIDDVTYRLAKLHIAYQVLVMIIIMIFGNEMFQLNMDNNRQHQTLAFNSLIMNNIFNLANCFNQFGAFNLRSGFRNHPFFLCVLLLAVFLQVTLTELNAFGLENLNPIQWFVCFVFALLSALIAPLTGQQQRQRVEKNQKEQQQQQQQQQQHQFQHQHQQAQGRTNKSPHHQQHHYQHQHHSQQQQQHHRQRASLGPSAAPLTPKAQSGSKHHLNRKSQASAADS